MILNARLWYAMPDYGTIYPTMIHYTRLWYAMPNYDTLYQTMIHYARLWFVMPNYYTLCQTMICLARLWYVMPNYYSLCQTMICRARLWYVIAQVYLKPLEVVKLPGDFRESREIWKISSTVLPYWGVSKSLKETKLESAPWVMWLEVEKKNTMKKVRQIE